MVVPPTPTSVRSVSQLFKPTYYFFFIPRSSFTSPSGGSLLSEREFSRCEDAAAELDIAIEELSRLGGRYFDAGPSAYSGRSLTMKLQGKPRAQCNSCSARLSRSPSLLNLRQVRCVFSSPVSGVPPTARLIKSGEESFAVQSLRPP